jgi:hypothetical protein
MKRLAITAVLVLMGLAGTAYAFPNFINGGFEDGSFYGWSTSGTTAITNAGFDPRTNNLLQTVGDGAHSARVGDQNAWAFGSPQYSSISQTETVQTTDLQDLYFSWAAVGLVPTNTPHTAIETPYFRLDVIWHQQGGGSVTLLSEEHFTGEIGSITPGWQAGAVHTPSLGDDAAGIWYYRPWTTFHMNLGGQGILVGDQLQALLTTRDCTLAAHASYAYLDGFGTNPPDIPSDVPEPSTTALLGLVMVGAVTGGFLRRRKR